MLSCHSMNMIRLRQLSNVIQVPLQQPNLAYKVFHRGGKRSGSLGRVQAIMLRAVDACQVHPRGDGRGP